MYLGFLIVYFLDGFVQVFYFIFYKNQEVIYEEEGIDVEQLENDVLYYGDLDVLIY